MKILWEFLQVSILNGRTMGCGSGISLPGMFRVVTDKTVSDFFICSNETFSAIYLFIYVM